MTVPFPDTPSRLVPSRDGTRIAVFTVGGGVGGRVGGRVGGSGSDVTGAPVLLVHGTGSDHTTWRAVAPLLAGERPVHVLDRRGRGASGDTEPYAVEREAEDIAAAAEALATHHGTAIAVAGHSLGGRLALTAARRTDAIGRVLAYEGAPGARTDTEARAHEALLARLLAHLARGDHDAVLEAFLREAGGLPEDELAAFRASDLWPRRAATAPQIVREMDAVLHDDAIGIDVLAAVTQPVLQVTGSLSAPAFRAGAAALDARLARGRLKVIEGARHNAHHTHAEAFARCLQHFAEGR